MSARKLSLPGRRTVTAILALAVLAGALAATGLSARKATPHPVHDRLGHRLHGQPGDERGVGDAGPPGRARLREQEQRRRPARSRSSTPTMRPTPTTAANVCNRLVNQTHVQAIVGFESTPSTAACDTYLQPDNLPYVLAQTSTSGSLCLPNYFSLANVGNQQVNPLMSYLTKNGTKKIYVVASDFASGHVGQRGGAAAGARRTARRSSARRTSRSARPTSRATSRRSPRRSPTP